MKKFLVLMLSIIMVASLGFSLVGCKVDSGDGTHTHTFKTEWSKDGVSHWHECKDAECQEISDKAEHDLEEVDGRLKCSVCEYSREIEHVCEFEDEYTYDEEEHWRKCKDAECQEISDKGEHDLEKVDGRLKCSVCDYSEEIEGGEVTGEQWLDAINLSKFNNVTADYTIIGEESNMEQTVKFTEQKVLRKGKSYDSDGYLRYEMNKLFTDDFAQEQREAFFLIFIEVLNNREKFVYNAQSGEYCLNEEVVVEIEYDGQICTEKINNGRVKFDSDGSIKYFIFDLKEIVGEIIVTEGETTFTLSNYGTTEITEDDEKVPSHDHSYYTNWQYDEIHHFNRCQYYWNANARCEEVANIEEHDLEEVDGMLKCSVCEYSEVIDGGEDESGIKVTDTEWQSALSETLFDNVTFDYILEMRGMVGAYRVRIADGIVSTQISERANTFVEDYMYQHGGEAQIQKTNYLSMLLSFLSDKSKWEYDEDIGGYISTERLTATVEQNDMTFDMALEDATLKFGADGKIKSMVGKYTNAVSGEGTYTTDLTWEFINYGDTEIDIPSASVTIPNLEFSQIDLDNIQDLLFIKEDNVQFASGREIDSDGKVISYATDTAVYSGNVLKNGTEEYISLEGDNYYRYYVNDEGHWVKIKSDYINDQDDFYSESDFRIHYIEQDVPDITYNAQTGLYELAQTESYAHYGECQNLKFGFVDGKLRYVYFEYIIYGFDDETTLQKVEQFIEYKTEQLTLPEINKLVPVVPSAQYYPTQGQILDQESQWQNAMRNDTFSHVIERVLIVSENGEFLFERAETLVVSVMGTSVRVMAGDDKYFVREGWQYYSLTKNSDGDWEKEYISHDDFGNICGTTAFETGVYNQLDYDYMTGLYKADELTVGDDTAYNFIAGLDYVRRLKYLCFEVEMNGQRGLTQFYIDYEDYIPIPLPENIIEPAQ